MARVDAFNKGRMERDDEFYTRYEDIQTELNHYEEFFKDKTVLCNCDDPFESNFCKFFLKNFNYLGLKRLICTSYVSSPVIGTQMTIFDYLDEPVKRGHGYVMDISEVPMANGRGVSDDDIEKLLKSKKRGVKKLEGDGDFRSEECIEYLKQADIVCSNPPFSLWETYVKQFLEYKKSFLIIGRETNTTIKDVFGMFKDNKIWYGYSHAKEFYRPDGTVKKFGNVAWFTNLDVKKRHEPLIMYKSYNPDIYPNYFNYDGIDVEDIASIPKDYYGDMGVPSSFLSQYNPEQFELVGIGNRLPKPILHKTVGDEIHFIKVSTGEVIYSVPYTVPERKRGNSLRINDNGKPGDIPFGRIIIRRKEQKS